jgi:predicted transcriptional regulator
MPERYQNKDSSTTLYRAKTGIESRITSFRCNTILRDRLYEYAESMGKDPSACIREAIGEYLHRRISNTPLVQEPAPQQQRPREWSVKR